MKAVLTIHDAEDVAVRVLEPGDFDITGDVNVALAPFISGKS